MIERFVVARQMPSYALRRADALMSYIADAPISAKIDNDVLLSRANLSDAEYNDWVTLEARDNFGLFRQQIRPNMIWGWWTQEVAWQLQRFYNEMVAGMRPKLAISSPPQHGKILGCY